MWWSLSGLSVCRLLARYRLILSPVTVGNRGPFHMLRWRSFQFNTSGPPSHCARCSRAEWLLSHLLLRRPLLVKHPRCLLPKHPLTAAVLQSPIPMPLLIQKVWFKWIPFLPRTSLSFPDNMFLHKDRMSVPLNFNPPPPPPLWTQILACGPVHHLVLLITLLQRGWQSCAGLLAFCPLIVYKRHCAWYGGWDGDGRE